MNKFKKLKEKRHKKAGVLKIINEYSRKGVR